MNFLIKFPTRSRPEAFTKSFETWYRKLSGKHEVLFLITVEEDDTTVPELVKLIQPILKTPKPGATVEFDYGQSKGKHHAINRGLEGRRFDVLITGADDLFVEAQNYDDIVAKDFEKYYPALDGALNYWDGFRQDLQCTMTIMGYNLYRRFGYIYQPAYKSLFGDTEFSPVVEQMHKIIHVPEWKANTKNCLIKHCHPVFTGGPRDALLIKNDSFYNSDEVLFEKRKAKNFDLKRPKLSILICTVLQRRDTFKALVDSLHAQIFNLPNPWDVEVLYISDNGEMSVGAKRNQLLDWARGEYICYVDDDDRIWGDYIAKILKALETKPECVGINTITTFDGVGPQMREYYPEHLSIGNVIQDGIVKSPPYHLNPIRADIAKSARFPNKNLQEDCAYAEQVRSKIKSGITIKDPIYHYDFSTTGTLTQGNNIPTGAPATARPVVVRPRRRRVWDAAGNLIPHPDEKR